MSVFVGIIEDFPTFPTGPTAGTYELGPFEFTPKAIYMFAAGDDDDNAFQGSDDSRISFGFAADGSSTRAINMSVEDRPFYPWSFVESASVAGTHLLRWGGNVPQTNIVVSTWTDCKLRLTISNPGHADLRVYYVVFGGDTLEAFVGSVTVNASGATSTVSGLPFEPDLVMFLGGQISSTAGYLSVGHVINNGGLDQYAAAWRVIDNNQAGSFVERGAGRVWRDHNVADASVSSFTSDGFVITPNDTPGANTVIYYMAIADPDGEFASGVVPLQDATSANVSLGFQPDAIISLLGWKAPVYASFPGGGLVAGAYGTDPVTAATRSGTIGAMTLYNGGGYGDPYGPARFWYQYKDDDRIASLWGPDMGFAGGPFVKAEVARVDHDGWIANDGWAYTEDTNKIVGGGGGGEWPSNTWPASPATEWSWLAIKTSPSAIIDPCAPESFVPQIYRRL